MIFRSSDPLSENAPVEKLKAKLGNGVILSRSAMIVMGLTIFGVVPLTISVAQPFFSDSVVLSQEAGVVVAALGFGYVAMAVIIWLLLSFESARLRKYVELYTDYIAVINDQHPLKNIVNKHQFTIDSLSSLTAMTAHFGLETAQGGINRADFEQKERDFVTSFLNQCKILFEHHSLSKCSVCIKILRACFESS